MNPTRVPHAVQRKRTQTSLRSLRKLDRARSDAPQMRDPASFPLQPTGVPGLQRTTPLPPGFNPGVRCARDTMLR